MTHRAISPPQNKSWFGRHVWLSLLLAAGFSSAEPLAEQETWYAIMLDDQKVGWGYESWETLANGNIRSTNGSYMSLLRGGQPMQISTREIQVEHMDGTPVRFTSIQDISGSKVKVLGTVDDNLVMHIETESAGQSLQSSAPWPKGALMPAAINRLESARGLSKQSYSLRAFYPSSQSAVDMVITIGDHEPISLFDQQINAIRTEQKLQIGGAVMHSTAWINDQHEMIKLSSDIMGLQLSWVQAPKTVAQAEVNPKEFFAKTFLDAPNPLPKSHLQEKQTYLLKAGEQLALPASAEQITERDENYWYVTVDPNATLSDQDTLDPESPSFMKASNWIQSDHPEIQSLAEQAVQGVNQDPFGLMSTLESFVRAYVSDKSLSVGYASALEVARGRAGDCTEHALLLAALGRALGIPTRIASGFAYSTHYLGAQHVFVPHAWTQAYIDGRWRSFDAALNGFDSGHIAFSYGNGDPWHFYENVQAVNNLHIAGVKRR